MPCTYHIQISRETVAVKIYDADSLKAEVSGNFVRAHLPKIRELHEKVRTAKSGEAIDADELGRLLFESLFHDKLRSDFFLAYQNTKPDNPLRVELEADERKLSDIVSLPWEFLCKPADEDGGIIRFASDPKMIFSRWRAQGNLPQPIRLAAGEDLRIVLAVADPSDFEIRVKYEEVLNTIKKLAQTERIGLSEFVNSATRKNIDEALKKNPHIFHFIGHGEMADGGKIALVNDFGTAEWIKADKFGELFNRHPPGVVLLQSCESGALSESDAYTGIASRVIQQQIPAVIAMQYEVSNATACDFASEFYRCLSKGNPADLAAQEARRHIELQSSGNTRDFATPVLFMRVQEGEVFQREIPNPSEIPGLIKEANSQERKDNPAYAQAIKKWRIVQQIDPDYPDAVTEIERLKQRIEFDLQVNRFLEKLEKKKHDIRIIHSSVMAYLTKMKKGTDDWGIAFLDDVKDFIDGNLSARDFAEIWKQFENKPPSAGNDPPYEILAEGLMDNDIIPFLGIEAIQLSQIAQKMAEKIRYEDFAGTLSMISQYYEFSKNREKLIDAVKNLICNENFASAFNPIYSLLKKIEKPFILISSSYDSLCECIFNDTGKKYAILSPSIKEVGKFIIKYNDKPHEFKCNEDISKILENGYSLIYKICGCISLDQKDDTLMISEKDFFAAAKDLGKLIPEYLIRLFKARKFLFLGYDLEQWHDRLIACSILEKTSEANEKKYHFAVSKNHTPYQKAFWKENSVDSYDVELQEFIKNLNQNMD